MKPPVSTAVSMDDVTARLDFLEVTPAELERVRSLQEELEPRLDAFVESFYEHLQRFPQLRHLLEGRVERLRHTQREYFRQLLAAEVDWEYVEGRLRVGRTHDWTGLSPDWYLSSFVRYVLFAADVMREQPENDERWRAFQALIKLVFFDIGLAIDAYISAREERLLHQQQALRELSAPVIEVWEDVLVLPLVGTMDTQRAQEVTEALLQGVTDKDAQVAIIDITGLPVMDTATANHLLKTVRAVELLGASVIVTGVRPAIAQTIVSLGIDTSTLTTKARLSDGLRAALELTGRRVVLDAYAYDAPSRPPRYPYPPHPDDARGVS